MRGFMACNDSVRSICAIKERATPRTAGTHGPEDIWTPLPKNGAMTFETSDANIVNYYYKDPLVIEIMIQTAKSWEYWWIPEAQSIWSSEKPWKRWISKGTNINQGYDHWRASAGNYYADRINKITQPRRRGTKIATFTFIDNRLSTTSSWEPRSCTLWRGPILVPPMPEVPNGNQNIRSARKSRRRKGRRGN